MCEHELWVWMDAVNMRFGNAQNINSGWIAARSLNPHSSEHPWKPERLQVDEWIEGDGAHGEDRRARASALVEE